MVKIKLDFKEKYTKKEDEIHENTIITINALAKMFSTNFGFIYTQLRITNWLLGFISILMIIMLFKW